MRQTILKAMGAAGVLLFAGQLLAGGFYIRLGDPEASPLARKLGAVLTLQVWGCQDPATAQVTAVAIGKVNGERREIPLKLEKLQTVGMYALTQQWPKEGRWVIKLVGKKDVFFTNSLIPAGPNGVDRLHDRADMKPFTSADVDALLQ